MMVGNRKRSIRSKGLFTLLIVLALVPASAGTALGAWVSLGGGPGTGVDVRVIGSSPDQIVIDYTLGGFDAQPVQADGRTYYRISLPGEGVLLEEGRPELPHVARSVIIPDGARMTVRVLDEETQDFPGLPVAPSKGNLLRTIDPDQVPYRPDPGFYGSDRWFPEGPTAASDPYIFRDYRGMAVDVRPFRAHGADGTLRVARHMRIELDAGGPDVINTINRAGPPTKVVREFGEVYRAHFLNYGGTRYTPVVERGSILVITYDDFHAAVQPYVDWKNQEGIPTQLVDVSTIPGGNTSSSIKSYIQSAYNAGGLAFVLLVGDAAQIATPHAVGGASDPSYSLLAGNDRYPEIFVGRFSAETVAQVQTQVARTLSYEMYPMPNGVWYPKGTGIGSANGPGDNGEYDYQHIEVIRGKLLNYGYTLVDQIYDPGATRAMVSAALNAGRTVVNYCGHGSQTTWGTTGFSNSDVNALTNDNMLPFIFSVACVNGQFENGTCFAEAWLRATHNGNPTGAIATYMSSIDQTWNPPMAAQDGAADVLVQDAMHTWGGMCFNGSCHMMDVYGQSNGGDMFLTWHIFGDPSLLLRTKTPQTMTVHHDDSIDVGQTQWAVTVDGVAGALCAVYGNGILYGSAYTDANGAATIPLNPPPDQEGTVTLTVTGYNKLPVMVDVPVQQPTHASVDYAGSIVNDTVGGDGDGVCDAGESIAMTITLSNNGTDPAYAVVADLSSDDPNVQIQTGSEGYGDIAPGGSATSQGPYQLSFLPSTPDGHVATLRLAIHAQPGHWDRTFTVAISRAGMVYVAQHADDPPPQGNGNGWVDPGETVDLSLVLANTGHANAQNLVATLHPGNPYVEIITGTATAGGVPAGGQVTLTPFRIRIRPTCPDPTQLSLWAGLSADFGYQALLAFPVQVGGVIDNCETNTGWTLGAPDDDAVQGMWINADPVGTSYGGQVVQPEDDHSPPPGTRCYVTGNGRPGGPADSSSVRGGKTTLLSPVFDLHAAGRAVFSYWVWYTNDLGPNPGEDLWVVQVTGDGANWYDLERTSAGTHGWTQHFFSLGEHLPALSDHVQLRFIASDYGAPSLVEALIDDVTLVVDGPAAGAPSGSDGLAYALDAITPNPSAGATWVRFSLPAAEAVGIQVYDVAGRVVRNLDAGIQEAGQHRILWDRTDNAGRRVGAGVYFVRLQASGYTKVRHITLIE